MTPVEIGATIDRSVIGIMVEFAKTVPYHLEPGNWSESTLQVVEDRLAETPCHAGRSFDRVVFPDTKTPELLRLKWLANTYEDSPSQETKISPALKKRTTRPKSAKKKQRLR
jgi:hypothetical protein